MGQECTRGELLETEIGLMEINIKFIMSFNKNVFGDEGLEEFRSQVAMAISGLKRMAFESVSTAQNMEDSLKAIQCMAAFVGLSRMVLAEDLFGNFLDEKIPVDLDALKAHVRQRQMLSIRKGPLEPM